MADNIYYHSYRIYEWFFYTGNDRIFIPRIYTKSPLTRHISFQIHHPNLLLSFITNLLISRNNALYSHISASIVCRLKESSHGKILQSVNPIIHFSKHHIFRCTTILNIPETLIISFSPSFTNFTSCVTLAYHRHE